MQLISHEYHSSLKTSVKIELVSFNSNKKNKNQPKIHIRSLKNKNHQSQYISSVHQSQSPKISAYAYITKVLVAL